MGGFIWWYFVSSHTDQLSEKQYFLQESGELIIPLTPIMFNELDQEQNIEEDYIILEKNKID